ncbi:MAG: hypothetical protein H3C35_12275 [Bacteroidetes bacterium]|nr:hypothetical protein [Bacteroidota bacterium]
MASQNFYVFPPIFLTALHSLSFFTEIIIFTAVITIPTAQLVHSEFLVTFVAILTAGITLFVLNNKHSDSKNLFTQLPYAVRVVVSLSFILLFSIIFMMALIQLTFMLLSSVLNSLFYHYLVSNIVLAGTVVLIEEENTVLLINAVIGFFIFLLLTVMLFLSTEAIEATTNNFIFTVSNLLGNISLVDLICIYFVLGMLFLMVRYWWISNNTFRWLKAKTKAQGVRAIIISFLLLLAVVMLFSLLPKNLTTNEVSRDLSGQIFRIIFSLAFIGVLFRSYLFIRTLVSSFNVEFQLQKTQSDKNTLIGQLTVAGAAIAGILLFPIVKYLGIRPFIIMLYLFFVLCTPMVSIIILSILWKKNSSMGITIGYFSGLLSGLILLLTVFVIHYYDELNFIKPGIVITLSLAVSLVTGITAIAGKGYLIVKKGMTK